MINSVVTARLVAAWAAARRATALVRRASAGRLAELLRLPPAERFAHLDEPALVADDRAALRRSLRASLPWRRRWLRFRLGLRARRHAAAVVRICLTPEIIVPIFLFAVCLGLAWTHTAHVATLTRDVPIRLFADDGRLVDAVLPQSRSAIVGVGWDGVPKLRHWLRGRGYETVPVSPDAIAWGFPGRNRVGP